jgi:cysteine desulfurase
MKRIYLDYAATTPTDPRVVKAMLPYFRKKFGNTMSMHSFGQEVRQAVEDARVKIANLINAESANIFFTSSATEANNLALKGLAWANQEKGKHIIISSIEHHCVLNAAKWLGKEGFDITVLPVDKYGLVSPDAVSAAIRKDTILVSIMHANNEIGTIEPIKEIGKVCSDAGVSFHTDAAQSFGKLPIDVDKMSIDMLTASSHKMYGPLGIAALYVRKGIKLEPLLHGGGQEQDLRSSTVNVAGAVGFGKAVEIAKKVMKKEERVQTRLRDRLIKNVLDKIEDSHLNGHPKKRLPNNANFWFSYIEGESLIMRLNVAGVAAGTGSACSSLKLEPSHVLLAIGLKPEEAHGSLRLSIGRFTKKGDIDYVIRVLPKIVKDLRKISPFKKSWKA